MKDAGFFSNSLDRSAPNMYNNKQMLRQSVLRAKLNMKPPNYYSEANVSESL